jgi:hypothetical protein
MFSDQHRKLIFISHAWEDYEFARWLALQLAREGYGVWCDLTKLLGGENWPREINEALEKSTIKFVFVLSKNSHQKANPLGEFQKAIKIGEQLKDKRFIIPLKIDSIPHHELDFRFQEIQYITFYPNWASGFSKLLERLKDDGVTKNECFGPDAVKQWWSTNDNNRSRILDTAESINSNRFDIISMPSIIYAHHIGYKFKLDRSIPYGVVPHSDFILSFAGADVLASPESGNIQIKQSYELKVEEVLNGSDKLIGDPTVGDNYMKRILNQAFEKHLQFQKLRYFKLSNSKCFFFTDESLPSNGRIIHRGKDELNSRIQLCGKSGNKNWHWALRPRVSFGDNPFFSVFIHVIAGMGRKRFAASPSLYRSWYNKTWRDRLRASITHIAEGNDEIVIETGSQQKLIISATSREFISPVSYEDPKELTDRMGVTDEQ